MTSIRTTLALAALAAAAAVPATAPATPVASVATVAPAPAPPAVEQTAVDEPSQTVPAVLVGTAPTPSFVPVKAAPHALFQTPEAAMRYLVNAYNRHDITALKRVTTPEAREALEAMRATATNLRLRSCTFRTERGDYECTFSHGFPASAHRTDRGHATFTVAPAARPGWYMTVLEECN